MHVCVCVWLVLSIVLWWVWCATSMGLRLLVLLVPEPVLAGLLVRGRNILLTPVVVPGEENVPLAGGDCRSDLLKQVGCNRGGGGGKC